MSQSVYHLKYLLQHGGQHVGELAHVAPLSLSRHPLCLCPHLESRRPPHCQVLRATETSTDIKFIFSSESPEPPAEENPHSDLILILDKKNQNKTTRIMENRGKYELDTGQLKRKCLNICRSN